MKEITFLACLCCTLFSYSNVEEKTGERFQTARVAFERGDYSKMKVQIDSIRVLCPKVFGTRHEGIELMQQMELRKQEKMLAYLDSMLQEEQEAVDAIKGNYAFGRDAEYQRIGNYLHPLQAVGKNLHHSCLRSQVDENGVMSMTSIYCGLHNIHHLAMKVTTPGSSFAEIPASKDSCETTDLGGKTEKADYKVGEDGNVVAFFNLDKDKNICVNYPGECFYVITITPNDRKAVAVVCELAQLLFTIIEIKKNKDETNLKIEFVKRKMVKREDRKKE